MTTQKCVHCGRSGPVLKQLDALRPDILAKAEWLAGEIARDPSQARGFGGKKLNANREMLSFRLSHKYRMLVCLSDLAEGPYLVMGHATYDHVIGR